MSLLKRSTTTALVASVRSIRKLLPVYVSIDLDGLDPAFAPGVSHREPGGLSVRDVIGLVHALSAPLAGADVVEFNPSRDQAGLTAHVAAKLLKELAGRMSVSQEEEIDGLSPRMPRVSVTAGSRTRRSVTSGDPQAVSRRIGWRAR
jgi:hypothetical protein